MAEKVTVGMEKIFFHYILNNPNQFYKIDEHFFKNDDIQFIYKVIKDEYIQNKNKEVPSKQQILAMVKINDTEKQISDKLIKELLKGDNAGYGEEWISQKFKAWRLSNLVKNNVLKSVDYIRGVEEINYDNVVDVSAKIKNLYNDLSLLDDDDDDLGDDFDDIESHQITQENKKMSTGWTCMDRILGGGWDQASLSVFMGETNVGKCFFDSYITVRQKDTGEISKIKIEDFYDKL